MGAATELASPYKQRLAQGRQLMAGQDEAQAQGMEALVPAAALLG